jgi:hypothetical protein
VEMWRDYVINGWLIDGRGYLVPCHSLHDPLKEMKSLRVILQATCYNLSQAGNLTRLLRQGRYAGWWEGSEWWKHGDGSDSMNLSPPSGTRFKLPMRYGMVFARRVNRGHPGAQLPGLLDAAFGRWFDAHFGAA